MTEQYRIRNEEMQAILLLTNAISDISLGLYALAKKNTEAAQATVAQLDAERQAAHLRTIPASARLRPVSKEPSNA